MAIAVIGMAWEVGAALVVPTGSITVSTVLLWVGCVVLDGPGGLVVVPDALAAFEATMFLLGGERVISGNCFLFLNCIHSTDRQYQQFNNKNAKMSHWACQFVYTDFW